MDNKLQHGREEFTSSETTMTQDEKDAAEYVREWRIWAGVAVVIVLVWGLMSLRAGHLFMVWPPVVVMGIWAAILLALPLFPRSNKS